MRRVASMLLTLWLLSLVVFAGAQLLPGDVGRATLGPLADARAVAELNHRLGTDRPAVVRYAEWLGGVVRGDLGESTTYRAPVAPFLGRALLASLRLAGLAFAVVVPLSVAAGVYAALHRGKWRDRAVTLLGLSLTVVPEFVSGIVLVLVFGLWLRWLPVSARVAPGAGVWEGLRHLVLPAAPLVLVLFGYLARIARAGTIDALEADYTRTAILKGLSMPVVLGRHVLRNALVPTVGVLASQAGYLLGGLVVVETLFRYDGLGSLILVAARTHDVAMLEAAVLSVGAVTLLASLAAEGATGLLDPRRGAVKGLPASAWCGVAVLAMWGVCALFGPWLAPHGVNEVDLREVLRRPSWAHPFGTDGIGRDVLSRVILGARGILVTAPLAAGLGTVAGTALGLAGGYGGGWLDAVLARVTDALVALPLLVVALLALSALGVSQGAVVAVIALVFAPLVARTVRAAVRAECAMDYVAAAQLRGEPAWRVMGGEILPNVMGPVVVEATVRLGYAVFTVASLSFLGFGLQPPSPDWGLAVAQNYGTLSGGVWWTVAFDAGATASLVVAVELVAEGLQRSLAR